MNLPFPKTESSVLEEAIGQLTIDYLEQYHQNNTPDDTYRRIVDEVERTLFAVTMKYTFGNQSKAALYLGINRATLRSKLKRHKLM